MKKEETLFYTGSPQKWVAIICLSVAIAMYSFCYTSNDFRLRLFTGIFFGIFSLPFIYELLLGGKLRVYALGQYLYWGKGKNITEIDLKKVKSIEITLHKSSMSAGKSNFMRSNNTFIEFFYVPNNECYFTGDSSELMPAILSDLIYRYKPDCFTRIKEYCLDINPNIEITETNIED